MSRLSRLFKRRKHTHNRYSEYCCIQALQPQDVFLAGYPKSGNTWLQLLVAAMLFEFRPETMPDTLVQELVPDLHFKRHYKRFLNRMAFKTHDLPRPQYQRVISIVRDGRDALCSYKHYNDALGLEHSMDDMIMSGKGLFPCQWHRYVEAWEENPFNADRLVVRYEDLKQRCAYELARVAEFLDVELSSKRLEELALGTGVAKMQQREVALGWNHPSWPKDKKFVRKGISGSYRNELSPQQIAIFEQQAGATLAKFGYAIERAKCA